MNAIRFSDGEEFDVRGPLHIEERADGLYVVGRGLLVPVDTREEAEEVLEDLRERMNEKGGE